MNLPDVGAGGRGEAANGGIESGHRKASAASAHRTIDAFNAWLAGQLPIAAGAGSGLQVLSDAVGLLRTGRAPRVGLRGEGPLGAAVDGALALDDQRWKKLMTLVSGCCPAATGGCRCSPGICRPRAHWKSRSSNGCAVTSTRICACWWAARWSGAHEALGRERIAALSALMRGAAQRLGAGHAQMSVWAGRPGIGAGRGRGSGALAGDRVGLPDGGGCVSKEADQERRFSTAVCG